MSDRLGYFVPCPACGYRTDTHSGIGPHQTDPQPGDASLCLRCGQVLLFTLDFIGLRLRLPTPTEMHDLLDDLRIAAATAAWITAFRRQPSTQVAA